MTKNHLLALLVLVVLAGVYLLPASNWLLHGRTRYFLSIGNDSTSLPFQFHVIREALKSSVTELLYGTIHTYQLNAPDGYGMWIPWLDRLIIGPASLVLPLELLAVYLIWVVFVINGMTFYAFAKNEGWKNWISLSLAICFAFNSYVRARAVVHNSLSEIYFLPAIFLALRILQKRTSRRSFVIGSALLLFASLTAHYYIMISVALAPLYIWFYLRDPGETRLPIARRFGKLLLAALPAVLFLVWNVTHPVHPKVPAGSEVVQKIPVYPHFLELFAAHPIDYLAHDVGIGALDLNPLREPINRFVLSHMDYSLPWERSNGIRWSLLLLFGCAVVGYARSRFRKSHPQPSRSTLLFFILFTAAAFWLSLPPHFLSWNGYALGPSIWVQRLIPNFRVPSRFGPAVHFGVLAVVGTWLTLQQARLKSERWEVVFAFAFPLILILDYSPLQPMPMRPTLSNLAFLERGPTRECGGGFYLPFLGGQGLTADQEIEFYSQMQRLKDTHCSLAATTSESQLDSQLMRTYGEQSPVSEYVNRFRKYVECAGIDWIGFQAMMGEKDRQLICDYLGWKRNGSDHCQAPQLRTLNPHPAECL
ncbi:MAG: hypothetical protein H7222_10090 [Methylotenera sp.]|nr:hypothetical protein [Oligoflexia bacterium]